MADCAVRIVDGRISGELFWLIYESVEEGLKRIIEVELEIPAEESPTFDWLVDGMLYRSFGLNNKFQVVELPPEYTVELVASLLERLYDAEDRAEHYEYKQCRCD